MPRTDNTFKSQLSEEPVNNATFQSFVSEGERLQYARLSTLRMVENYQLSVVFQ